jgi:hypothetical protein
MNLVVMPLLNRSLLSFSKVIKDVSDATLNDVYRQILHGFVTESQPGYFFPLFIDLNETEQNPANVWFRNYFLFHCKTWIIKRILTMSQRLH